MTMKRVKNYFYMNCFLGFVIPSEQYLFVTNNISLNGFFFSCEYIFFFS